MPVSRQITASDILTLIPSGITFAATSAAGTGYVPGDTIVPSIPGATVNILLGYLGAGLVSVVQTQVVAASIAAGGTGGTNGAHQTVTGTTGTGTKFQADVTIAGGIITAVNSITVAGAYSINPTAIAAEPVTGASLTGAQLSLTMGVLFADVQNRGSFSSVPVSPAAATQASTSGSGTGATFNITFAPQAAYVVDQDQASGTSITATSENTRYGFRAGTLITVAMENSLFGWRAGAALTKGGFNTAVGACFLSMVDGSNNVAVGTDSIRNLPSGSFNTAVGQASMHFTATAGGVNFNTVVGGNTLANWNPSGSGSTYNTGVGFQALMGAASSTFTKNVAVGALTGQLLSSGSSNLLLGHAVGSTTLASGSNNILIGTSATVDTPTASTSNYLNIGGVIAGDMTSALQIGSATVKTTIVPPTADPHVVGALWNNAGTLAISAG